MFVSPKISIIVPVYKVERYLHQCINSILSQTFTDFELILVDDGSPDNSGAICDKYAKKDHRVIVAHKENGGVSSARNAGLQICKGEWITFIDADDYIEQDFLSIPAESPEDLLFQNYKVLDDDNLTNFAFQKGVVAHQDLRICLNDNIYKLIFRTPWGKFFRREIITEYHISFIEGVKIGEDTLFVLDYLYHTKSIRYISQSYYIYRKPVNVRHYKMPVSNSLEIFHILLQAYSRLRLDSIEFLHMMFQLYFYLIFPKDYKSVKAWQTDKEVKRVYAKFKFKWRFRYAMYPIRKKMEDIFLVPFKRS